MLRSRSRHHLARTTIAVMLATAAAMAAAGTSTAQPVATVVAAAACGSPLSSAEIGDAAALSDPSTVPAGTLHQRLETEVARNARVTAILTAHHDRRGLFGLGLDAVEQQAVMPLQRNPSAFRTPEWAAAISLDLLTRYLTNVHDEFTGQPTQPQWARYFTLAGRCALSPARVAMTGYNAHLTVDLAHSVAAADTAQVNVPDYYRIVDSIAQHGDAIVTDTKEVYGADLGPLWHFYFLGEGLDRLAGQGVATGLMLRAADDGYNTLTLANGFGLENPQTRPATESEIQALWGTADTAFTALSSVSAL